MSMLSAQIERLRRSASDMFGEGYALIARDLFDAADTIDELRTRLQELQRYNSASTCSYEAENNQLRALVRDMYAVMLDQYAGDAMADAVSAWSGDKCKDPEDAFLGRMRKLRIEVDG